jgi:hypothetical protein
VAEGSFSWSKSLCLATFESGSRLSQIENEAFAQCGLIDLVIPASVEVLGEKAFSKCRSHFSARIESGSRLSQIESISQSFGC